MAGPWSKRGPLRQISPMDGGTGNVPHGVRGVLWIGFPTTGSGVTCRN
jgi:hypothetical protein